YAAQPAALSSCVISRSIRDMGKLILRNVGKRYDGTDAVADFSLELAQGEFVALLGPSGCGKTTTLRMIAGFTPPSTGTIELDGETISTPSSVLPPEKRRMSMIFQSYAIWPNMTVGQNVAFGLEVRRLSRAEIDRRVDAMLDVVQMRALKDRYPSELSGGQQQRVALARSIVVEPEILLLDEPLSNLDAALRDEMRVEIRRLHDEFKITTVYVTHDQAEAMVMADRIAVMNKGRIEQIDVPHVLYGQPRSRFVAGFIGRTNFVERDGSTYSVRPQAIRLSAARPAANGVEGEIVDRAYLGEYWDYQVRPLAEAKALRVATAPSQVFETGQRVWLEIDPGAMVRVDR
ncbi:MAG TPA: ABC transporter ATP-binding protein, partial [Reyranellaceae bacterium]|nr:ABC transporter ATP-binding protein [Reyranellaceae bacterium]